MRRLYRQIYLTIIGSLLLLVVMAGAFWKLAAPSVRGGEAFEVAGEVAAAVLPPADAPGAAQQKAIDDLAQRLRADLALFDKDLNSIGSAGRPLPAPMQRKVGTSGFGRHGPAYTVELPDGRWLVARVPERRNRNPAVGLILFLGALALAVAIAAYPFVRGLTRRLERLQTGVESLGAGDLSARVKVEGKDEIAHLAESFNSAAVRIETLVGAHKMLLANASHELRTPLSRLRMSLAMLEGKVDAARRSEIERDIAELDQLIDEILLSSRLEQVDGLDKREAIDLLGLAAEECARTDFCEVSGTPVVVSGDERLLRRLVRNLIENARRHGEPPVEVEVTREQGQAVLRVSDRGPGVALADRERIFEPFFRSGAARGDGTGSSTGAGLGLALVRQIARRHGGDVVCAPYGGRDSVFTVTLPATAS